ncbi:MAG: hypothetical protein ACRDHZ_01500 [Ktedonobacteraceae bacterium]
MYPAVEKTQQDLAHAQAVEAEELIGRLIDGAASGPSVTMAEELLAKAEQALAECRHHRLVLGEEEAQLETRRSIARKALDEAVAEAIVEDPARAALVARFERHAARALRYARSLASAGFNVRGHTAHGLRLAIFPAAAAVDEQVFFPDRAWTDAIAALHEDPDTILPGLPPADDN